MSLETQNMIKWMEKNTAFSNSEIAIIVKRAFKHDTEQMQNERNLVQRAIYYKHRSEEY